MSNLKLKKDLLKDRTNVSKKIAGQFGRRHFTPWEILRDLEVSRSYIDPKVEPTINVGELKSEDDYKGVEGGSLSGRIHNINSMWPSTITINEDLPPDARLATLIHELQHARDYQYRGSPREGYHFWGIKEEDQNKPILDALQEGIQNQSEYEAMRDLKGLPPNQDDLYDILMKNPDYFKNTKG